MKKFREYVRDIVKMKMLYFTIFYYINILMMQSQSKLSVLSLIKDSTEWKVSRICDNAIFQLYRAFAQHEDSVFNAVSSILAC